VAGAAEYTLWQQQQAPDSVKGITMPLTCNCAPHFPNNLNMWPPGTVCMHTSHEIDTVLPGARV
jgi:hypothetical protein